VKTPNVHVYKDENFTLTSCWDGFRLYDKRRGINLAMRAPDPQAAFIAALTYYARSFAEVNGAHKTLQEQVAAFVSQFSDESDD
jgi:hypothetical protein